MTRPSTRGNRASSDVAERPIASAAALSYGPGVFEFVQLRCFVTVAEELHFGRAAARLNMTQPPLSRHIQVLERILNVELFERSSRSVKLTGAGSAFLSEAARLVGLADSAVATARAASEGRRGTVTLGFTAASAYSFLPRFLAPLQRDFVDVRFVLRELVTREQLSELLLGRLDLGLLRPPLRNPELGSVRLLQERFVVCSHASVPADQRPTRMRDFDNRPFIMYAPDQARYFHDLLTGLFASAKAVPRLVQHLAQIHSILSLVGAAQGFALVPESATRLHPDDVVFSELEEEEPVAELHAAWREGNTNPVLRVLLAQLRAVSIAQETTGASSPLAAECG